MPYVRIWVHLVWSTKNRESMLGKDIRLIRGQEEHHRKKTFSEEFQEAMRQHGFIIEGLKSN